MNNLIDNLMNYSGYSMKPGQIWFVKFKYSEEIVCIKIKRISMEVVELYVYNVFDFKKEVDRHLIEDIQWIENLSE